MEGPLDLPIRSPRVDSAKPGFRLVETSFPGQEHTPLQLKWCILIIASSNKLTRHGLRVHVPFGSVQKLQ